MSVFHVPPVSATDNARAAVALERLCEHVEGFRTRPLAGEDFEWEERELHERFVVAEREVLGELLERLDVDARSVEVGGRRLHRVHNSTESYTTAVGAVKVSRTLYRCGPEGLALHGSLSERNAGEIVETFAILTTEAKRTMRTLHHRMPVILAPEAADAWLAGDDVPLGPAPEDLLAMHRVSKRVKSPRHDDSDCVALLEPA